MFKTISKVLATVLMAVGLSIHSIEAKEMVIAVSPSVSNEELREQTSQILNFAVKMEPQDTVIFVDGYNLKTLGRFVIPDDPRYKGKKIRINVNKQAVAGLLTFTQSPPADPAAHNGALKLPELLDYVSRNIKSDEPLDVIVIGSALYHDPQEPAFSMRGRRLPGDGHLNRSRRDTPFGTLDGENNLKDMRLHLAFMDDETALGGRYKTHVERFWRLFTEAKGGALVTFSANASDAFANVKRGAIDAAHSDKIADTDKLEMIEFRPVELEVRQSIFERPLSKSPLSRDKVLRADNLEIGISWHNCKSCDLDLYVQATPSAPVLFYANPKSAAGRYWKDYTQAPEAVNGFETVSYHLPLDLRAIRVGVNFYSGQAGSGVRGEIRVSVSNQTFAAPFTINAAQGIGSEGVSAMINAGRSPRPETLMIDILSVINARS